MRDILIDFAETKALLMQTYIVYVYYISAVHFRNKILIAPEWSRTFVRVAIHRVVVLSFIFI